MPDPDPHEVLGIARWAPRAAIKTRYRELARRYHPDVNGQDPTAEWVFKQIQSAYAAVCANADSQAAPQPAGRNGRPGAPRPAADKRGQGRSRGGRAGRRHRTRANNSARTLLDGWFGWVFAAAAAGIAAPIIAAGGHGDQNTTLAHWIGLTACLRGLIRIVRP